MADKSDQEEAVTRLLNVWSPASPELAGSAVEHLPAGAFRDYAIGAYVEVAGAWRPDAAALASLKISDPVQRQQKAEQCFRYWRVSDSESAERWLKESDFNQDIKNAWLSAETTLEF
jgi:hypothetical protein